MSVVVVILTRPSVTEPRAPARGVLAFDAPRIVIGRGGGADVIVPDPSVSPRHATLQAREGQWLLSDAGSTNGTFVGRLRLAPHAPRPLRSGERVRVGRVWLELRNDPLVPASATPEQARALALGLVEDGLRAAGEAPEPVVTVLEGPDAGARLPLAEAGRTYSIGRGADCDLPLAGERAAGRRQLDLARRGDAVVVRMLSQGEVSLEGRPVSREATWRTGQRLRVGATLLGLEHPAAEALAEIEASPDEVLSASEAPSEPPTDEPEPADEASPEDAEGALPEPERSPAEGGGEANDDGHEHDEHDEGALAPHGAAPPESTWSVADLAIFLVALGVIGASLVGWYVLR